MDEFDAIMEKYGDRPLREHFESVDEIKSCNAVIHVKRMKPGNVIETHEHKGDFKEW